MEIKYFLIFLLRMFAEVFPSEKTISKWKRRKEECKMSEDHVTGQKLITTLNGCIAACQLQSICETISWKMAGKDCLFSSKNVVDDNRAKYIKWELSEGWVTFSKVNYPVARVMNPAAETELMGYTDAVQTCLEQGSTIATPSDLIDAKDAGMNTCACAWLSTGDNGGMIPLSGTCSDFNSTTKIEYCGNTGAVAWCKLN